MDIRDPVRAAPGRDHVRAVSRRAGPRPDREMDNIAARRADALAEITETYMNNNESSGSTADRYQVIVHVSASPDQPVGAAPGRDLCQS